MIVSLMIIKVVGNVSFIMRMCSYTYFSFA